MRDRTGRRLGLLFAALAVLAGVCPAGGAVRQSGDDPLVPIQWAQAVEDTGAVPATPNVEAPVEPDTVVAPEDTLTVPLGAIRRRAVASPSRPNVAWTTIRSGILPGWGQLANGKPLKAVLLGGIYTGLAAGAVMAESDRRDIQKELDAMPEDDPALVEDLNDAVDRRNFRMWMMGATMLYAMIDAYVDVHFAGFEETWSAGFRPDAPALAVTVRF
jgi:hypothetical protein